MIDRIAEAAGRTVPRETFEKLQGYVALIREENQRQNLVSAGTLQQIWERHILDSAQLVRFERTVGSAWIDLGSGAGLPGVVVACLVDGPVTMVEPRRLRADFLHRVSESLRLTSNVICSKAENVSGTYDIITARAVAPLSKLLQISQHLSTGKTLWILPKGRSASSELAQAKGTWQGTFHVERSLTDEDSYIVVGSGVRARGT